MLREIDYVIWKEGEYYVSQCINVDVSSFGKSIEEAISSLKEAVSLYLENEDIDFSEIDQIFVGREKIDA